MNLTTRSLEIVFYISAFLTILSALVVVLSSNMVRMAVGLLFALLFTASMYLSLNAQFLAAVQIIMYVGGVVILILFGIMLTENVELTVPYAGFLQTVLSFLIAGATCYLLWHVSTMFPQKQFRAVHMNVAKNLGTQFLSKYIVIFELASVLLVGVLIGAAYLVRREVKG